MYPYEQLRTKAVAIFIDLFSCQIKNNTGKNNKLRGKY